MVAQGIHRVYNFAYFSKYLITEAVTDRTGSYGQLPSRFKTIRSDFVNIPDSIQTSIYWYWISGNISKEGVVRDLEALKKVGINRAIIGTSGFDNVPDGKVKMFYFATK